MPDDFSLHAESAPEPTRPDVLSAVVDNGQAQIEPAAPVRIATHEFDWQPTVYAGDDYVPGNRGTDIRLDQKSSRTPTADRLALRKARRVRLEGDTAGDFEPDEHTWGVADTVEDDEDE